MSYNYKTSLSRIELNDCIMLCGIIATSLYELCSKPILHCQGAPRFDDSSTFTTDSDTDGTPKII